MGAPVIHMDHYFKQELPQICSPDNNQYYPDWNSPESIRINDVLADILAAKEKGESEWLIVEGMLLFYIESLYELLDFKIFVTAKIETCLYRRIVRNISLFNQSPEYIGEYYLRCARHREAVYCLPFVDKANFVIDNDYSYEEDFKKVSQILRSIQ